jgi:hypothetical protein
LRKAPVTITTAAAATADLSVIDRAVVLLDRLAGTGPVDKRWSELVEAAVAVWSRPGFDTFVSAPHLRFEPFAHQLAAAKVALQHMHGRAILADEVGLGKPGSTDG